MRVVVVTPNLNSLYFNKDDLVFNGPQITFAIARLRGQLGGSNFFTELIYNKALYINIFLSNLTRFFSLRNFYDVILLANLYPLFLGFSIFVSNYRRGNYLMIFWLLILMFVTGISQSQDKSNVLYLGSPILLFFILQGLLKVNSKIYLGLLILSLGLTHLVST